MHKLRDDSPVEGDIVTLKALRRMRFLWRFRLGEGTKREND